MATTNGAAVDAPVAFSDAAAVIGKRKRSSSPEKSLNNGTPAYESTPRPDSDDDFQKDLSTLLKLIESDENNKSILTQTIPASSETQPFNKRLRLSGAGDADTVNARIEKGVYTSIDNVVEDVQAILARDSGLANGESVSDSKAAGYATLKKEVDKFSSERLLQSRKIKSEDAVESETGLGQVPDADSIGGRLVLQLFGNTDRGPRQLYSSLQLDSSKSVASVPTDETRKSKLPKLDETYLPNGITATKVKPYNAQEAASQKKATTTFGQAFRPHHTLKPLEPPKPSRSSTSSTITWVKRTGDDLLSKVTPTGKDDYKFASLPTGQWLQYAGPRTSTDLISFNEQLNRERGIPLSDKTHSLQPSAEDLQAAREKALFQAAYSSFAPVYDDGESIISEKVKSQMWWRKTGSSRLKSMLAADDPPETIPASFLQEEAKPEEEAEEDFSEAVESFVADESNFEDKEETVDDKELSELLEEISDHLRTLVSYQAIRQATQSNTRIPISENSTFSTPTSAESEVYELLKTQLSLMVSTLPPYAVAKLDGDQLGALGIGTKVLTSQDDFAGVMEVDEYTYARQRAAASASASVGRPSVSGQSRPGSYHAASTPVGNYAQRPYTQQRPAAATPYSTRPAYAGATPSQNYAAAGRPAPQTVPRYGTQQPYSNSPSVQQFQRPLPNGYGGTYNSHQQAQNAVSHAQNSASSFMQRPTQPGYQQRAQDNAARGGSPQKPLDILSRVQYPASAIAAQQPRYFQQQTPQAGASPSPAPAASPLPPNANPAQIERARLAALYNQRAASGTPQPANGQPPDRSITPGGGQQNGVGQSATPV